jgi:hypothetical protein
VSNRLVSRAPSLVVAASCVALEGLTALGLGGFVAVETVVGAPSDVMTSIGVAGFGLLVGAALLWVGWGLLTAERWSRAPAVLTQILALPIAGTVIQSDQPAIGVPLIVVALVALVAILAPPTTRQLYGDDS